MDRRGTYTKARNHRLFTLPFAVKLATKSNLQKKKKNEVNNKYIHFKKRIMKHFGVRKYKVPGLWCERNQILICVGNPRTIWRRPYQHVTSSLCVVTN